MNIFSLRFQFLPFWKIILKLRKLFTIYDLFFIYSSSNKVSSYFFPFILINILMIFFAYIEALILIANGFAILNEKRVL